MAIVAPGPDRAVAPDHHVGPRMVGVSSRNSRDAAEAAHGHKVAWLRSIRPCPGPHRPLGRHSEVVVPPFEPGCDGNHTAQIGHRRGSYKIIGGGVAPDPDLWRRAPGRG